MKFIVLWVFPPFLSSFELVNFFSKPYEPVTIQVIPKHFSPPEDGIPKLGYDHSKVIAFPSQLVFTPNNYSSPQSVTLFAVDDDFDQVNIITL